MFGLSYELERLAAEGKEIAVSIIGVGQMGRALVSQMVRISGMTPVVIIDHKPARAIKVLLSAGVPQDRIVEVTTTAQANAATARGCYAVGDDQRIACEAEAVQVVIDVTGNLEAAAAIAIEAFANRKHVVMMTVETDVVIGTLLNRKAQEAGVIYTGMAGDEPGAIMELYDFARSMGLDVLVLGKGKNNEVNYSATPETAAEEAQMNGMNPRMLASFQDCTKTQVELCAVANATGLLPDCMGAHGVAATTDDLAMRYRLKSEGGVLNNYGVVDYVKGVAPGVFAIVTTPDSEMRKELKFLSMGDGPNYLLYRPYHLCSMEVPITVGRLMLHGVPSLVPLAGAPHAEVVAFAKRDLAVGETLDGIGGYTVYGVIESYDRASKLGALPVGLVNEKTIMKRAVRRGEIITTEDVQLDEGSILVQLRHEQDRLIEEGKL